MMTPEQRKTAIELLDAIHAYIVAAGPMGVPSGELYALLMGKIDIHVYQSLIGALEGAGKVTIKNHLIRATDAELRRM